MAEGILGLLFEIAADPSKAEAAMAHLKASTVAESADISSLWSQAMNAITGPTGIALGAMVGLGGGMLELGKKAAEFVEEIGRAAERSGATAEQISTLKFAADRVDVSFEAVSKGTTFLARNLGNLAEGQGKNAALALEDIGVKATDAQGHMLPVSALLPQIVDHLGKMENGGRKTADSMALFGRGGSALIPVINSMRDGFDAAEKRAAALGVVITDKDVEAGRKFTLAQKQLTAELQGFTLHIGQWLLPRLTEWFAKLDNGGILLASFKAQLGAIVAAVEAFGFGIEGVTLAGIGQFDAAHKAFGMMHEQWGVAKADYKEGWELGDKYDKAVAQTAKSLEAEAKAALAAGFATGEDGLGGHAKKTKSVLEEMAESSKKFWEAFNGGFKEADEQFPKLTNGLNDFVKALHAGQVQMPNGVWAELPKSLKELNEQIHAEGIKSFSQTLVGVVIAGKSAVAPLHELDLEAKELVVYFGPHGQVIEGFRGFAATMDLLKSTSPQVKSHIGALSHEFAALKTSLAGFRTQAKADVGSVGADFKQLNAIGGEAFRSLAAGMASSAASAIVYERSFSKAMAEVLKSTLASITSQAIVRGLEATALGFLDLAYGDIPGAEAAFESAAIWAVVGGVAGAVGRAIPGGGGGASRGGSGGRYGGGRDAGGGGGGGGAVPEWADVAGGQLSAGQRAAAVGASSGGEMVMIIGSRRAIAQHIGNFWNEHVRNGGLVAQNPHPAPVTPGVSH